MNLLAHAYLTPPGDPDLLVGNLTADWIKGRNRRALPESIQRGFELHRRIDTFTDTHLASSICGGLLEVKWPRYAPILIDVFFDHILAANWGRYSIQPFAGFVERVYDALRLRLQLLPEHAQYATHMMIADDWLAAYASVDGIRLTLTRMSTRLQSRGHDIELAPAADELIRMMPELDSNFSVLIHDFQKLSQPPRAA